MHCVCLGEKHSRKRWWPQGAGHPECRKQLEARMGLRSPQPSSHTPPRSSDLPSISQGRAPCENTEHKPKSSSSYFTEEGVKSNLKPRFAKGDPPHSHCALCSRSPPVYGTVSISHKLSLFLLQTNTEYLLSIISLFSQQTASRGPQGTFSLV